MAVQGMRNLIAGRHTGGETTSRNVITVDEVYYRKIENLRQVEKGLWESRGGFSSLSFIAPDLIGVHSQFDYQRSETTTGPAKREHIVVAGKSYYIDGVLRFTMSSAARGRFIQWSINNILYYLNGTDIIRYDGTTVRVAGMATPTTALSGTSSGTGQLTAGNYKFRVKFVSDVRSGNLGPESAAITATSNSGINLTSIPIGPSHTRLRKIYRTRSGGDIFFEDLTINDNTATTGRTERADSALGEEHFDSDSIPLGTIMEIYNDHLFVAGDEPDKVSFSLLGSPESFDEDDFIEFPGKTGDVTGGISGLVNFRGRLYIFRHDGIFFAQGNNRDDFFTSVNAIDFGGVGVIAPDSIQVIDGLIYFLAEDGPYVFDGIRPPRSIGGHNFEKWNPFSDARKLNAAELRNVQSVYYKHRREWWVGVPTAGMSEMNQIYVYNHAYRSAAEDRGGAVGSWYKFTSALFPIKNLAIIEGQSGSYEDIDRVIVSNLTGRMYVHDTIVTDNGTAFTWRITTPEIDFDLPTYNKRWYWFTPIFEEKSWGTNILIRILFDGLGDRSLTVRYDLGSRYDTSVLWGQMIWNNEIGFWETGPTVPSIPVPIHGKTGRYINVFMEGTADIKFSGYHVAAQVRDFASGREGTIRSAIRY